MGIKKGVVIQKLGETFVAYDNAASTLHEFNEAGFLILKEVQRGKNKDQIVKILIETYGIDKKSAKRDVESFLKVLKRKKLITLRK